VTDHGNQLREAFQTHEHLAPDPVAVYAKVQELARKYQRRRRGAQAAGGALLGAGLIAGAVQLPGLLAARPSGFGAAAPASATPSLSATPSQPDPEREERWNAYFAAGYGYNDALKLAQLWNSTEDVGAVKAEAGRRLLAGETLPIPPTGNPDPGGVNPQEQAQVDAFFAAGYSYDHAVQLAELWNLGDPYRAKVEGGRKLLAGEPLPIRP
jgi:hypothetical protein